MRYVTIDGLRGLAALFVTVYHLYGNLKPELSWLPSFVTEAFSSGYIGVPIFFVLSGFVIAVSIGNADVTPRYIGNFALRRSIRLDPTYWASIGLALLLLYVENLFMRPEPYPSIASVIAHAVYLQNLLGFPPEISEIYWTLCIEIQLYLFFVFALGVKRWVSVGDQGFASIICALGVASLALDHELIEYPQIINHTFLPYWHYFLLGVITSYAVRSAHNNNLLFTWVAIELLFVPLSEISISNIAGIATATFIFAVNLRDNGLSTVLGNAALQYLGRISYTLYLLHADIGWKVISLVKKITIVTPATSLIVLIASVIVSVIAAHVLHVLVERPSVKLAAQLKQRLI